MSEYIHVSVAWPYSNGDLHLGHLAGALLPADIFARYHRLKGNQALMVSGSDTHGTPVILTAANEGATPTETFEKYHHRFLESMKAIGLGFDLFTHTDTENHHRIAQDFFMKLLEHGYLYVETQKLLYDEVAERFLPDRFVEGTCPVCGYEQARGDQCDQHGGLLDAIDLINPRSKLTGSTPVIRETDHYFLDLAKLKDALNAYLSDKDYWRSNVISFARNMVDDLRGRPYTRDIDWGIRVPLEGWEEKRLYVWFEALMGYFTATVEWAHNQGDPDAWKHWWYDPEARIYNFLGKDNIPFHTILWQAQLIGVDSIYDEEANRTLNLPYDVPANEFMQIQGAEFSKSRNWAVWLHDVLERYDPDAIRYYVSATMPETRDTEFTWQDFVTRNNSELVGWWGNLVNRVITFAHKNWDGKVPEPGELRPEDKELLESIEAGFKTVGDLLDEVKLRRGLDEAMTLARSVNVYLDTAPWYGVIKEDKQAAATTVYVALQAIDHLKTLLSPYLPFSSQKVHAMLGYEGQIAGDLQIEVFTETERKHEALTYDHAKATGKWEAQTLPPGQAFGALEALFAKLDEEQVVEAELARMGA